MKTVGEILKIARTKKQITLNDVSRSTKISTSYLEAIENNDFSKLPPSAFTKGFMQNYAKVVDLDPKLVLAVFRRDYDQDNKGRIIPRSLSEPVKPAKISFTPSTISLVISIIIGVIIAVFFIRQIIVFNSAPQINLTSPQNNNQVSSPVHVQGDTQPSAIVEINNQQVGVDENGSFSTDLTLTSGEHTLVITATSRNGKKRTIQTIINVID